MNDVSTKYTASVIGGGTGGQLSMRALAASTRFELVAACDLQPVVCEALRSQYPDIQTFTNHKEMLESCPTDVVCVSTYPPSHEAITLDALALPLKGILVEKPLGHTAASGRRILAEVEKRQLPMAVPHGLLVKRTPLEIIERVRDGQIGQLKLVEIQCRGWDIINAGIHWLNFFVTLTNNEPIDHVLGICDTSTRTYRDGMQVETVAVTAAQTQSGIRVVMHTGDTLRVNSPGRETVFRLVGTEGQIEFWGWADGYRILNAAFPAGKTLTPHDYPGLPHQRHLENLADMIDSGRADYSIPRSSLLALELCEGAYMSSRQRCLVRFPVDQFSAPPSSDWEPGMPYAGYGGGRDGRKLLVLKTLLTEDYFMEPITFGVIGGGWRSAFYLRIAKELPERFKVAGVMVRDPNKGKALEKEWGVAHFQSIDDLLRHSTPSFVVLAVPRAAVLILLRKLAAHGIPVLSETPPAQDLDGLLEIHKLIEQGARFQVAEQYPFQPLHAAQLEIVRSGKLGVVTQAQVSVAHGYHGMALIRRLLDVRFDNATITARTFISPIVAGPDRGGPPDEERIEPSHQVIAHLDFGTKLGIYDFAGDQYFSWIRSHRLLARGDRGEIQNTHVRFLQDFRTPVTLKLRRQEAGEGGNLEGYYHKGILAGDEWVYRNPFGPARLSDEEVAISTCLDKMAAYVNGGPEFYPFSESAQDCYLDLMIRQALDSGQPIRAETQPWASGR